MKLDQFIRGASFSANTLLIVTATKIWRVVDDTLELLWTLNDPHWEYDTIAMDPLAPNDVLTGYRRSEAGAKRGSGARLGVQ